MSISWTPAALERLNSATGNRTKGFCEFVQTKLAHLPDSVEANTYIDLAVSQSDAWTAVKDIVDKEWQKDLESPLATNLSTLDCPEIPSATYERIDSPEAAEFFETTLGYRSHLCQMNRSLVLVKDFLHENDKSPEFRKMLPEDVEKLSNTELGGFLFWLGRMQPFSALDAVDKEALLRRYSVRKLSLDHFYQASKHKDMIADGNFVMLNNTFVPPNETGFEGVNDDEKTRVAKHDIFRPTLDRLWATIVVPFAKMRITDAEIVTLHILLLWSAQNNRFVTEPVKEIMRRRREWAIARLFEHYEARGLSDAAASVRLTRVLLFLPEIEVICEMHYRDFHMARKLQLCGSGDSWLEEWCYNHD